MQTKQKSITQIVSENPKLTIYFIMVIFGLMVGYMSEAEGKGDISPTAVIFASILVFPGAVGIFYELYKKIKGKSIKIK
ncbi:hypothetical protein HY612_01075 [Candidatus Roizmanbacteria bacterium]|nr:hypothetical protein [Candidatus Roizmanbacteria bacterium]